MGSAHDTRDWHDVAGEIEIKLVVDGRVDRVRRTRQEERVSVGGCTHDRLSADIASRTRPAFDEEGLDKAFGEPLTHQARENVA
jgi:hypothetical protein